MRVAAALALFLAAWSLLHVGFYERDQIVDTPVYEGYGTAVRAGEVPYRDFDVEYPPGALTVFVLPTFLGDDFRTAFEWLMALCGGGMVVATAISARRLGLGLGTLAFVALAPLAIGSVILTRFDLWPAMLTSFAIAALVHDRLRVGHVVLGAAVAVKLFPGVLLPLAVAYAWRRRGRREALVCVGLFAVVVAAAYLPFVAVAPVEVASSVDRQLSRPLQIESLGSAVLLALHDLFGLDLEIRSSHGSQNLDGTLPTVVGLLLSLVQVLVVVALWVRFALRERAPTPRDLVAYGAAVLSAFVALGKVFSPQFLIWLVPVVPLVKRFAATALLGVAIVLTQLWFPFRYWDLAQELDSGVSWLVLARDVVLLALLAVLVQGIVSRRGCERSRSA